MPSFWFDGKKWFYADQDAVALGRIKSVNLSAPSISPLSSVKFNFNIPGTGTLKHIKNGDTITCQYIKNYDGDTITVMIPSWPPLLKNIDIRLAGIDTPELRGSSRATKEKALKAKDFVADLCQKTDSLILRNVSRGKYFRLVADVYVGDTNISAALLDAKLAVPYDGGTKPLWN